MSLANVGNPIVATVDCNEDSVVEYGCYIKKTESEMSGNDVVLTILEFEYLKALSDHELVCHAPEPTFDLELARHLESYGLVTIYDPAFENENAKAGITPRGHACRENSSSLDRPGWYIVAESVLPLRGAKSGLAM